jgi:hypothetical protein
MVQHCSSDTVLVNAVMVEVLRPLWSGYEYPWLCSKSTVDFLTWCTSMVMRCEELRIVTWRKASSRVSVSEGICCSTESRVVMGEEGLGGILPAAVGARRPPLPPLAPLAWLLWPCPFLWIGIQALSIVWSREMFVSVLCCAIVNEFWKSARLLEKRKMVTREYKKSFCIVKGKMLVIYEL